MSLFPKALFDLSVCPSGSLNSHRSIQAFGLPTALPLGAGSELVVLVFEQDVERGERSVTARNILLQVRLVRIAQFVARVDSCAPAYFDLWSAHLCRSHPCGSIRQLSDHF